MTAVLEAVGLSHRFGSLQVISELSFDLAAGEALGVVGPNGAGKTTLLNLLAGDFAPSGGRVLFKQQDVTAMGAHQRAVLGLGRTSQIPRPFGGLTVFENVMVGAAFGGRQRGKAANAAAWSALDRADLGHRVNVKAGSLTLLDRKRLELARALATGPEVLLLDEIAGGLTEAEVRELITTINHIRGEGTAIVWIEHIVHALLEVVDRVLAIDYGRKLADGDPHEVMASDAVKSVYLGDV